jgi:hypothetical protein
MPVKAWSPKRARQYEHVKEGLEERGKPEDLAEEIAARTMNKERARAGESKEGSRTSVDDISSGRRGGLRSHKGAGGRTAGACGEPADRSFVAHAFAPAGVLRRLVATRRTGCYGLLPRERGSGRSRRGAGIRFL